MKLLLCIPLFVCLSVASASAQELKLPVRKPEVLKAKYDLDYWGKLEVSGIVRSRSHKNVFWIHNDSGDQPRVFAIDSLGKFYQSDRYRNYEGIAIAGATNVDWEDIAIDDKGNLFIADVGNNYNDRKDLVLYVVPEPSPMASNTTFLKKLFFKYPDQKTFTTEKDFNYDCEGVFFADGRIHMLSKDRSDTFTRLYRMDVAKSDDVNELTLLGRFDIGDKVTAADASADGNRLAVMTYNSIWLFERKSPGDSYFKGSIWWFPIEAPQVESMCFKDDQNLWLVDEETSEIYEVPVNKLIKVR